MCVQQHPVPFGCSGLHPGTSIMSGAPGLLPDTLLRLGFIQVQALGPPPVGVSAMIAGSGLFFKSVSCI